MLQPILAVTLVLLLFAGTLFLLRRKGLARFNMSFPRTSGRPRQMQMLERLALSPQHSLHLVRVNQQVLLVGISPSGCCKLARYAAPKTLPQSVEPR